MDLRFHHYIFYTDPLGNFVESNGRLSGIALVWEHHQIILRLEGPFTKDEALQVAAATNQVNGG